MKWRQLFAVLSLLLGMGLASIPAANAEIVGEQKASWGLATFGNSRTVANFSALGWGLESMNGNIYVGGNFLDVTNGNQTQRQPYFASFNSSTGAWNSGFRPQVEGPVLAMAKSPDGGLFVAGEMGTWNGTKVGPLVKINPNTGDIWPGWNTLLSGSTNVVREVSLEPDGQLYAVGRFTRANDGAGGRAVSSAIRLNPNTGKIDFSWLPEVQGGSVWGVSKSRTNDTVYLAGWFDSVNGAANQVVGVSASNGSQNTWTGFQMNYRCCDNMYDIEATEFGTVLAVGEQHGAYMYDENQNMRLIKSHVTSYDSRFQNSNTRRGGDYQEIERVGNRLYATCHCWGSHSSSNSTTPIPYSSDLAGVGGDPTGSVNSIIAYDVRNGDRIQSFNPRMSGDIGGFGVTAAPDGCVWVAGGINSVGQPGSQRPGRDLVRLCDEDFGGGNNNDPVPPATCTARAEGANIEVTWPAANGATEYVVYRTVNGNGPFWRGKTSNLSFTDNNRSGAIVYSVKSKIGNRSSATTTCSFEAAAGPQPVANCSATRQNGSIQVTWPAANGAAEYVVYRTVNGNGPFWRGKTSNLSFTDGNRSGTIVYSVASKNGPVKSDPVLCTPQLN